ncbi:MAG: VWA domain-containing protein [Dehalococcoidia bacterium]
MRSVPLVTTAIVIAAAIALGSGGSARADQPVDLWLPWEGGALWTYTQGPHGNNLEALDFQPPDAGGRACEAFDSSFWVTAAANGRVVTRANGIEIDHGGGFSTGYYHLDNRVVENGQTVTAGQRLGTPGCCPDGAVEGCWATGPHLHFYTVYRGARQLAAGLDLGGWLVAGDGCLVRNQERVCSDSRIVSNSPRSADGSPSGRADIVLIIDTSASVRAWPGEPSRVDAAMALLQAAGDDDNVAVVAFNSKVNVRTGLKPVSDGGYMSAEVVEAVHSPDTGGRTNIRAGLAAACSEILGHGTAPARAAVLITDGRHNVGSMKDAETCLVESGVPVFAYGIGNNNRVLLQRIADDTGGDYKKLSDVDDLYCEFRRIRSLTSGDPPGSCSAYQVAPGDRLSLPFHVPPNQDQATLEIRWRERPVAGEATSGGSRLHTTLLSPSGTPIELPLAGVQLDAGQESISYKITRPTTGVWYLSVDADNVPDDGLYVTFAGRTIPHITPTAQETPTPELSASPTVEPVTSSPTAAPSPTPSLKPLETRPPTFSPTPTPKPLETPPPND